MAWLSDDMIENSTNVVQNVFGRYRFLADATLGEGDIPGNARIEVISDHDRVQGFFGRVRRVGARRSCRSRQDNCLTAHFDDVGGMPAARPFIVKGMNGPALEGCDGCFDKAAFV